MNDFENKLRSRKFLPPPDRVRQAVLAARDAALAPKSQTWREWLWPSPLAWGAAAALLVGALIFNAQLSAPRVPAATARAVQDESPRLGLYAFYQGKRDLGWLRGTR
jgi:hypothetical protein